MTSGQNRDPVYELGHTLGEQDRLSVQGQLYGPHTRQLFVEAGVAEGMRVLDVGCGAGDVSLLAAELVGPTGAVVGVDRSDEVLETARRRALAVGLGNLGFVRGELNSVELAPPFDALVGRFMLMHLGDPAAVLRHLLGSLRPGGVVAFQESDLSRQPYAWPASPLLERIAAVLLEAGKRPGSGWG
jgi:ubiquinone/menaquinone biosynthesis C-methylase UbiE